jgi:DNA-directed RNA polymerase subunit E'/Rpb7
MEHTALFQEQVALTPRDLRKDIAAVDAVLLMKLKSRLESRCSRHGYVVPDSVKILSRSMGVLEKGRFTGSVLFTVQAEGTVLNPPDGEVVEGVVIRKNKMGMYVNYKDAVRVIVPRDLHIGNEIYETVELRDVVKIEIKKSRFQVNDPFILSVGLFQTLVRKGGPAEEGVAAAPATEAMLTEEGGEEEGGEEEGGEEEEDAAAAAGEEGVDTTGMPDLEPLPGAGNPAFPMETVD